MPSVTAPLPSGDPALPVMPVRASRATLHNRSWQGTADDGTAFAFELAAPLRNGDLVHQSPQYRYVIAQEPEALLEVSLDLAPSAAAGIGWAIGNAHLELAAEPARLLTPDLPGTRQLLERLQVPFTPTSGVFRPGRFARGSHAPRELGPGHRH